MVSQLTNATSFTSSGLRDWLIQRVTSVILGAYFIFLLIYSLNSAHLDYFSWQLLFAHTWMRVFTVLSLLSLFMHAWIGIWTVITDYVKVTWLRLLVEILVVIALVSYLIWGIAILWGS